ncbi:MAG: hypothetical protein H3C47_14135 [Candidatus Cloacimonetes bacterium]|nr:hypothetical protein [Candidatus Cloacimonadota bacterium]
MSIVLFLVLLVPSLFANSPVKKGDLWQEFYLRGELDASSKTTLNAPNASDRYDSLTVEWVGADGTEVKTGDVILEFDKTDVRADIQKAEQELAQAEGNQELVRYQQKQEELQLKLSVERARILLQKADILLLSDEVKVMSKMDIEKSKLDRKAAEMELSEAQSSSDSFYQRTTAALEVERLKVDTAQSTLKKLKDYAESLSMRATVSGVLYRPFSRLNNQPARVNVGSVVGHGNRLLEILNLDSFDIQLFVRQSEAAKIQLGDQAKVWVTAFPETPFDATVIHKDSFTTARKERLGERTMAGALREVGIRLKLSSVSSFMRPGMTVTVSLKSLIAKDVLQVPLTLVRENAGVLQVRTGPSTYKEIKTGRNSSTMIEVLHGLELGEIIYDL